MLKCVQNIRDVGAHFKALCEQHFPKIASSAWYTFFELQAFNDSNVFKEQEMHWTRNKKILGGLFRDHPELLLH